MATPLETQFASNLIQMFGGSELLVGLTALGFFIALISLARIPIQVTAPLYAMALIIVAIMIPTFAFVFALVLGFIIATFIYSIWAR